jgi:hemerythrin-like domain-containing protein
VPHTSGARWRFFARLEGVDVERAVRFGDDAAAVIVTEAEACGAGLIAMATDRRAGLTRVLKGSVAERVERATTVPVILAPYGVERLEAPPSSRRLRTGEDMKSSPIEVLRDEHRVIEQMLAAIEAAATCDAGLAPPDGWWEQAIDSLRTFADRNHHAKEEASLFPAMIKAGVPREDGPISVMLEEYVQGRALLQAMATGAPAERETTALRYVQLLRDHIHKENELVFPPAENVLDAQAVASIGREFEAVEAQQGRDASAVCSEATVMGLSDALRRMRCGPGPA